MTELHRLAYRIEAVKDASMFEKQAAAEAALSQLMKVLTDQNQRIEELEKANDSQSRG